MAKKDAGSLPAVVDPYAILDVLDEGAFVREMAGAVVETYVYEVETWDPKKREKVKTHQLSKSGVDAVCRELAERNEVIREEQLDCVQNDVKREAVFHVKATRYRLREAPDGTIQQIPLDSSIGVKRQPYNIWKNEKVNGIWQLVDTKRLNPHWYEHGAMKAARNARRRLIPEAIAVELIKAWGGKKGRAEGRVREVTDADITGEDPGSDAPPMGAAGPEPAGEPASSPAPESAKANAASAEKQKAEASRVWAEINELLTRTFGKGAAWDSDQKLQVLEETYGTRQWKAIRVRSQNEPARFLKESEAFDQHLASVASA